MGTNAMGTNKLLFIHGAGGYVEDRIIADGLGEALGLVVELPEFSATDMSFESWAGPLRALVDELRPDDVVVGHSFGASILLRVLAEKRRDVPTRATLLAMPDWSPDGWDVAEYEFTGSEPNIELTLHHCRDDDVVPFSHLALNLRVLPSGRLVEHAAGGHQFDGVVGAVAAELA